MIKPKYCCAWQQTANHNTYYHTCMNLIIHCTRASLTCITKLPSSWRFLKTNLTLQNNPYRIDTEFPTLSIKTMYYFVDVTKVLILLKSLGVVHHYYQPFKFMNYKTDTHTHTHTDRQTPDKVIPMCRYARQHNKTRHVFEKHRCPRRQQSQNMAKISKS